MNAETSAAQRGIPPAAAGGFHPVRLVSVETARAARGATAEQIFELVEDHGHADHLPAFDVSLTGRARRELRIWAAALRPAAAAVKLDEIIADCLLTDAEGLSNTSYHLHNSQLERAWCVSNDLLLGLIKTAEIAGMRDGRNWRVNRASAAAFLRRRAQ